MLSGPYSELLFSASTLDGPTPFCPCMLMFSRPRCREDDSENGCRRLVHHMNKPPVRCGSGFLRLRRPLTPQCKAMETESKKGRFYSLDGSERLLMPKALLFIWSISCKASWTVASCCRFYYICSSSHVCPLCNEACCVWPFQLISCWRGTCTNALVYTPGCNTYISLVSQHTV